MPDIANQIKLSRITNPAIVRDPDDGKLISMFLVEVDSEQFWFEAEQKFADNGYDFYVVIKNVGLRDKSAAGNSKSPTRRRFSEEEMHAIKGRLETYFLTTSDGPDLPNRFKRTMSKRLGVQYSDDWIVVE